MTPRRGPAVHYDRWNFEGLTHITPPFHFRLTLCGLRVVRFTTRKARADRRSASYLACKRCYK